ncbi:site-specific integrase, partial [Bacteroides uniformis]
LISESVSIESIAKMMGHSNISTTQGYARITEEKISREMDRLMEKRSQSRTHSGSDSQ